jgi:hypothetical protein
MGRAKKKKYPVEMIDGARCWIRDGKLMVAGKDGIPTPADKDDPAHKWFWAAFVNSHWVKEDGTYYAVGPHFCGNPYHLDEDFLEKQGRIRIYAPLDTEDDIREYFRDNASFGIVFYDEDGRAQGVIRREQYGFRWPVKESEGE